MSNTTIPFLKRNQVTTPSTGMVTPFYDVDNSNVLTFKDSECNFTVVGDAPDHLDTSKLDDCICELVKAHQEDYGCALKKGHITSDQYESFFENLNMFSSVTYDPYTGSFVHGVTTTPVLFTQLATTNALCNGMADGTANITITGGTAPYTTTWVDSSNAVANPAALSAGAYTVTVNDMNNTTKVTTFVITEPPALTILVNTQDETGVGLNDGIASAVVAGGTPLYTYEWRDNLGTPIGQTTQTATGLAPGTYQVVVTDANGCLIDDLNVVIDPA